MQMRNQTNTDVQNPQQDAEPIFKVYGENYKVKNNFWCTVLHVIRRQWLDSGYNEKELDIVNQDGCQDLGPGLVRLPYIDINNPSLTILG